ncbi:MAG TPA: PEP-CTERM sorting domain-containing protein [Opitutales bacterium]|jgi:hypothetical protein|nr:PEP-CTERM sorting domain-containing protein [Opitutales bacterium]
MRKTFFSIALLLLALSAKGQTVVFSEDFESTTGSALPSGWVVDSGKFGISAPNPLVAGIDTSNRVFAFSASTNSNDTFSQTFDLSPYLGTTGRVFLSFDFLSNATTNHAGLIGLAVGNDVNGGSTGIWQDGSPAAQPGAGQVYTMVGTGAWESVSIDVSGYINDHTALQLQDTSISFEQWDDASVANSVPVYFDNVSVSTVPEPGTYGIIFGIIGLLGAIWFRKDAPPQGNSVTPPLRQT